VNAGGNIDFGLCLFWGRRLSMKDRQFEFADLMKVIDGPVVFVCGGFEIAQHTLDVDDLALVGSKVFA
jgi:hypothetical protein